MSIDNLAFENDDQRRRAIAWVVALASTFPVAAQRAEPLTSLELASLPASSAEPPATHVYQLIYRSTATELFTNQDLLDLLEHSRRFNLEHQITGILLYSEGQFVQAMEGQQEVIKALFERIQQDPRHQLIETVAQGRWPDRWFSEWSMDFGYAPQPESGSAPGHATPPLPGLSTTSAHLKRLLEACIG